MIKYKKKIRQKLKIPEKNLKPPKLRAIVLSTILYAKRIGASYLYFAESAHPQDLDMSVWLSTSVSIYLSRCLTLYIH